MILKDGFTADYALQVLNVRLGACNNVQQGADPMATKRLYMEWVEATEAQLTNLFEDDLASNLYTPHYWEIFRIYPAVAPDHYELHTSVRNELRRQGRMLQGLVDQLTKLKTFCNRPGRVVVPDTSAFTRGVYFKDFDWPAALDVKQIRIVVPILVVEELDKLKYFKTDDQARKRARGVLKALRELTSTTEPGAPVELRRATTIEVLVDDDWHQRLENNDGEIISQALQLQRLMPGNVTLACVDASMEFRARERGLATLAMPEASE